jgi:hypothetical protein
MAEGKLKMVSHVERSEDPAIFKKNVAGEWTGHIYNQLNHPFWKLEARSW